MWSLHNSVAQVPPTPSPTPSKPVIKNIYQHTFETFLMVLSCFGI
jgi:hypothetical protein